MCDIRQAVRFLSSHICCYFNPKPLRHVTTNSLLACFFQLQSTCGMLAKFLQTALMVRKHILWLLYGMLLWLSQGFLSEIQQKSCWIKRPLAMFSMVYLQIWKEIKFINKRNKCSSAVIVKSVHVLSTLWKYCPISYYTVSTKRQMSSLCRFILTVQSVKQYGMNNSDTVIRVMYLCSNYNIWLHTGWVWAGQMSSKDYPPPKSHKFCALFAKRSWASSLDVVQCGPPTLHCIL